MKKTVLIFGLILFTLANLFAQRGDFPKLSGPYLGQKPPGMTPEIFAPGIVSTSLDELNSVFSPDGQELYFCVRNMGASSLFIMNCAKGVCGRPGTLPYQSR